MDSKLRGMLQRTSLDSHQLREVEAVFDQWEARELRTRLDEEREDGYRNGYDDGLDTANSDRP